MIAPSIYIPSGGHFLNIPHLLKEIWGQHLDLNSVIPATHDAATNRFFSEGVEHLNLAQLDGLASYVVVNDLNYSSSRRASGRLNTNRWPFRIQIYTESEESTQAAGGIYFGDRSRPGEMRSQVEGGVITETCYVGGFQMQTGGINRINRLWRWQEQIEFVTAKQG